MRRVAVIGNAGSGKSTLSQGLGAILKLPVIHLDSIFWRPGWQRTPLDDFLTLHDRLLGGDGWVIDGVAYWESVVARVAAADTVMFPDYPLWLAYRWAYRRQIRYAFRPRPDLPPNCPMLPKTWELAKVIWRFHTLVRPRLLELLDRQRGHLRIVYLRSPDETSAFLRSLASG